MLRRLLKTNGEDPPRIRNLRHIKPAISKLQLPKIVRADGEGNKGREMYGGRGDG